MMGYLYVIGALLAGLTKGYCGKKTSGVITGLRPTLLFNAVRMLLCVLIGALFVMGTEPNPSFAADSLTLLISAVSGISTAAFVVTWIGCVRVGAYMMVDVFITLGVIIPILLSSFLFGEEIRPVHILGLLLLIVAAYLMCTYNNTLKAHTRMSPKQLGLLSLCGALNGVTQFAQKWLRYSCDTDISVFNFYTYVFAAGILFLLTLLWRSPKSTLTHPVERSVWRKLSVYVVLMSACLFLHSFFSSAAAGYLSSAQLYPLMQGSSLVLSMVMSAVCFGERITPRCVGGIVVAFCALLCINLL